MEKTERGDWENRKIRTGVIGVGSLGRHHVRNYSELSADGGSELVAVCDVEFENAKAAADEYGCEAFSDWPEMLGKVDAISVVTPTQSHCEIACAFLESGVHVLAEKPIARTLEEADKMIAAAEKSGAMLMVGHLERFNPAMTALRPHVANPLYFEIHRVSPFPNRSLDVDVVLDVMIHDLDAVQWMVGSEVGAESIEAVGIPIVSDKVDAANARIGFANGAVANITASRVGTEKIRKTRFYQPSSYVVLDYGNKFSSVTTLTPNAPHPLLGIKINRLEIDDIEPLHAELSAFLSAIRNGGEAPVTAADGRRALELAMGVLEKIEAHRKRLHV
ncbi:MAG: Gfo/Idh/MocA family oxidoreductase [Pyrinomonadaceae bacterium]